MIEKAIVTVISLILLIVLSLQVLLLSLPLFQRMLFDALCHQVVMQMDRDGGLTVPASQRLQSHLEQNGFIVEMISGTENVPFGEEASLYVKVSLPVRQISSDLQMITINRSFTYVNSTLSRKYATYPDEP